MTVGIGLSYQYATAHQEQPQQPRIGDSRDLQLPVLAAARADVFVTRDAKLHRITERVPMERFRVSTLKGFLEELDGQTAEGGSN